MRRRSPVIFFDRSVNRSPQVQGNLDITQRLNQTNEALQYARRQVASSSNTLSAEVKETEKGRKILEKMNQMRAEVISEENYTLPWIMAVAEQAKRWRMGNCCEKSCVAFQLLLQSLENNALPKDTAIELFNNPFIDHFFVVVGRDIETDASNPETWNKDTIVYDPWAQDTSYFLQSVRFFTHNYHEFEAIRHLGFTTDSDDDPTPSGLILKQNVLSGSNGTKSKTSVVFKQDRFVLRSRHYNLAFTSFNENVPMCYESWDYPSEEDYQKQRKIDKKLRRENLFSSLGPR